MTSLLDTPAGRNFIKAISTKHPEVSVALVRDELDVLERLPEVSRPVPTLRAKVRVGGWIALVTDAVPGRSPGPGVGDGLPAGLDALSQLRDAVPCAPAGLPSVADRYAGLLAHVPSLLQRQPELVPAGAPPGATEETVDRILAHEREGRHLLVTLPGPAREARADLKGGADCPEARSAGCGQPLRVVLTAPRSIEHDKVTASNQGWPWQPHAQSTRRASGRSRPSPRGVGPAHARRCPRRWRGGVPHEREGGNLSSRASAAGPRPGGPE